MQNSGGHTLQRPNIHAFKKTAPNSSYFVFKRKSRCELSSLPNNEQQTDETQNVVLPLRRTGHQ